MSSFFAHWYWWNLGNEWEKGSKRSSEPGFIAVTLSFSGMFSVSFTYHSASVRPPTQSQLRHIQVKHMHLLHLTGWKSVMIAFFLKRGQILHVKMCPWITCCTANSFYSPRQVREIKGVKGAWGANRGRWGGDCFVLSAETLFYGCSVYNFAAVLCVCVFSPSDRFGLTCPQGWIKPVKDFACVCLSVCERCSEMY